MDKWFIMSVLWFCCFILLYVWGYVVVTKVKMHLLEKTHYPKTISHGMVLRNDGRGVESVEYVSDDYYRQLYRQAINTSLFALLFR